jgi:Leucine-rich repeat (LRR) protein
LELEKSNLKTLPSEKQGVFMKITTNCIAAIKSPVIGIGQLGKGAVIWIKSQFDAINTRIRKFSIRFFTKVVRTIIGRDKYEFALKLRTWVNDPSTTGKKARAAVSIFRAYCFKSTYLNLVGMSLNSLPTVIGDLTHLHCLYLSNNNLTALPAELGNLTTLRYFQLNNNNLETLPAELVNLNALRYLQLDNNNLETLPEQIGNLTNLVFLYLSNNNLTTLPAELVNLNALHYLDLENNNLTTLPVGLENLPNLIWSQYTDNNLAAMTGIQRRECLSLLLIGNNARS